MPESVKTAGHRKPDVLKNLQVSLETRVRRSTDGAVCFASDQHLDGTVRTVHGGLVDMMPGKNDSNPNCVGDALESAVGLLYRTDVHCLVVDNATGKLHLQKRQSCPNMLEVPLTDEVRGGRFQARKSQICHAALPCE